MHAAISFLQHCVSCIWRLHLGHHHHHRHHHLHYIIIIIITIEYVVDWLYLHIAPWPVAFFLQHTRLHFCTTHKIAQLHCCTKKHRNKTQINANNTLDKNKSQRNLSDSCAPSKKPMFSMMTLGRGGSVKKQMTLGGCKRNTWWVHYQLSGS